MNKKFRSFFISIIVLLLLPFYSIQPISAVPFSNFIVFNGGTVNSQLPNPVSVSKFEAEFWVKPYSTSGIRHFLTISDQFNQANYQVSMNGGSLSFFYRFGTNSQRSILSGNLQANAWQKVKVTVDSSATKLFINDSETGSYTGATNLKALGPKIETGKNFSGEMDQLSLRVDDQLLISWLFDEARGQTTALDSSVNGNNGVLTGNDSKVHFNGALPTPTKFVLPTLPSIRRITIEPFPTGFGSGGSNSNDTTPAPTWGFESGWVRSGRPALPR